MVSFIKNKTNWLMASLVFPFMAHAEGLGKTKSLLQKVFDEAHSLVGIVIAIAVLVVGFRVLFRGETIRDCWGVILGAGLISAAAEVGKWLS